MAPGGMVRPLAVLGGGRAGPAGPRPCWPRAISASTTVCTAPRPWRLRTGALPFRQVFSSQGPLFLPLVWLFDLLGLRTLDAPRLLAWRRAWRWCWPPGRPPGRCACRSGRRPGGGARWGQRQRPVGHRPADLGRAGPGLRRLGRDRRPGYRRSPSARWAVAGRGPPRRGPVDEEPLFGRRRPRRLGPVLPNRRHLGAAVAAAGGVGLACALPWGLGAVWDQAFRYHLEAAGTRTPLRNLRKVASTLGDRDLPLVAGAALVAAALGPPPPARRSDRRLGRRHPRRAPGRAGSTGAGACGRSGAGGANSGVLAGRGGPAPRRRLAAGDRGGARAGASVVAQPRRPPRAAGRTLVAARADRLPGRRSPAGRGRGRGAAAVVLPYHAVHPSELSGWRRPRRSRCPCRPAAPADRRPRDQRRPRHRLAGRPPTPADLVDTSMLRIESGRLTPAPLVEAATGTCAPKAGGRRAGNMAAVRPTRGAATRAAARYGGPEGAVHPAVPAPCSSARPSARRPAQRPGGWLTVSQERAYGRRLRRVVVHPCVGCRRRPGLLHQDRAMS